VTPHFFAHARRSGRRFVLQPVALACALGALAGVSPCRADDESATRKNRRAPAANEPADELAEEPTKADADANVDADRPLKISASSRERTKTNGLALGGSAPRRGGLTSLGATFGSLAVVLGLFGIVAWFLRKARPKSLQILPREVFESLGRAPLTGRLQAHLFRCGNKLLLVSITPGGAETLTEIIDPLEVDRLTGLCRQEHPQSTTASFRQIWQQFAKEKTAPSFVDAPASLAGAPEPFVARVAASRGPATAPRGREAARV
jgi:flagellar biogenesis protein FliO